MDTLYFKNVTAVCFSLLILFSNLFADKNETQIFLNKYGKTAVIVKPSDFTFKNRDKVDLNLTQDINKKSYKEVIKKIKQKDNNLSLVKPIVDELTGQKMQARIKQAKKYILDDLNMTLSDYNVTEQDAIPGDIFSNEKMFLCISSSMPKKLIQNYLDQIEENEDNIEVVLNGFIGGIKKVKKTIKFINSILMKNKEEAYRVKIQINPKIFMNYNIKEVPALIYDPNFQKELLEQEKYKTADVNNSIVIYGSSSIKAMIKKIDENK